MDGIKARGLTTVQYDGAPTNAGLDPTELGVSPSPGALDDGGKFDRAGFTGECGNITEFCIEKSGYSEQHVGHACKKVDISRPSLADATYRKHTPNHGWRQLRHDKLQRLRRAISMPRHHRKVGQRRPHTPSSPDPVLFPDAVKVYACNLFSFPQYSPWSAAHTIRQSASDTC